MSLAKRAGDPQCALASHHKKTGAQSAPRFHNSMMPRNYFFMLRIQVTSSLASAGVT